MYQRSDETWEPAQPARETGRALSLNADETLAEAGAQATFPLKLALWAGEGKERVDPDSYLFGVCATRFHEVLTEALSGLVDPESQLRGLLRATFDFAQREPHAFASILSMHHEELAKDTVALLPLNVFSHVLQAGMDEGLFWSNDPVLAAAWVVALVQRTMVLEQSGRFAGSRAEIRGKTIEAAVRLVKTPLEQAFP